MDYELIFFSVFAGLFGYIAVPVIIKGLRNAEEEKNKPSNDLKNKKAHLSEEILRLSRQSSGYSDKHKELQITCELMKAQSTAKDTISGFIKHTNSKITSEIRQAKLALAEKCIQKIQKEMPKEDNTIFQCLSAIKSFHKNNQASKE